MKSVDRPNASRDLARWLRLGSFITVVGLTGITLSLRSVQADAAEVLWGVGAHAMVLPPARNEGVRRLELNGIALSFKTQTVGASLTDVLDHYEALCGTPIATQAARNVDAGYVACLDLGPPSSDLSSLANRFVRFAETGDLQELGAPRYIFARRLARRSADSVFLLTMWTDSAFDVFRMLPRDGADAAGRDLVGVPRPPDAQRIVSASETGKPSGVVIYRVEANSAEELQRFYRNELPRDGWTIVERNHGASLVIDGTHMISAEKANRLVTVLCHQPQASPTLVTVLASEPS